MLLSLFSVRAYTICSVLPFLIASPNLKRFAVLSLSSLLPCAVNADLHLHPFYYTAPLLGFCTTAPDTRFLFEREALIGVVRSVPVYQVLSFPLFTRSLSLA